MEIDMNRLRSAKNSVGNRAGNRNQNHPLKMVCCKWDSDSNSIIAQAMEGSNDMYSNAITSPRQWEYPFVIWDMKEFVHAEENRMGDMRYLLVLCCVTRTAEHDSHKTYCEIRNLSIFTQNHWKLCFTLVSPNRDTECCGDKHLHPMLPKKLFEENFCHKCKKHQSICDNSR